MPQSLCQVALHIIYSTKDRQPFLKDPDIRKELYAYMAKVLQNIKCDAIIINGVEDHIHILCNFSRTITIADLLEETKKSTSKWIKTKGPEYRNFYWQLGYGSYGVSESLVPKVRRYIENQEEHHKKMSFQDEFRILCKKHGIEIDERYCWD